MTMSPVQPAAPAPRTPGPRLDPAPPRSPADHPGPRGGRLRTFLRGRWLKTIPGRIRAHVQHFPLDRVDEAYAAMRAGELEGRAVIVPNG